MNRKLDLTGKVFTRLTVLEETDKRRSGSIVWKCLCECGKESLVSSSNLMREKTKSCGCLSKEMMDSGRLKHGGSNTSEYKSWKSMKGRCYNKNDTKYEHYGGRGISVCESWVNSFENFILDLGVAPNGTSLDRIDVNGDYTPENCRWADIYTQNFNQRLRKNNTSGKTGVSWVKEKQKWRAAICLKGKFTILGCFESYEEAVKIREAAEINYMGITKK